MAVFRPFKAVRPLPEQAHLVASRPYDVLSSSEARREAEGNPLSFLRVIKPEIELPISIDPYSDEVYEKGAEVYNTFKKDDVLVQDSSQNFYIYRLTMEGRTQTGLVGCCHFEEYFEGKIKKHELTRVAKEEDRVKHVDNLNAKAEPVFFYYLENQQIDSRLENLVLEKPVYDFVAADQIRHELWIIDNASLVSKLEKLFSDIPYLYVADGHHRTAAAARIGERRKKQNPDHTGDEEYNLFLAVLFSDQELEIFDYNRVIKDLNGLSPTEFIEKISGNFSLLQKSEKAIRPCKRRFFGLS